MSLLLTDKERERFVAYLEQDAASIDGIVAQMESIRVPEGLTAKLKSEALAARIIAAKLRSTESMSISAQTEAPRP